MGAAPRRTSNARISGIIAGVTVAIVAVIVFVVPPLATNITTTRGGRNNSNIVRATDGGVVRIESQGAPVVATVVGAPAPAPAPQLSLPPAGSQQPPDPAAAVAEVTKALETLFSGANPREVRLTALDDRTNVEGAMDGVREQYPEASNTSEPELAEIIFTDAEHSFFLFRLRYTGAPLLPTRMGTARLVDGKWLITRNTLCEVLSSAGSTCGPPAPSG